MAVDAFTHDHRTQRLKGTLLDDSYHYCKDRKFHPLALPVVGVISDSGDDRGNRRWQYLVPRFYPCLLESALDGRRSLYGVCARPNSAAGRTSSSPRDHAAPDASNAVPYANRVDHFGYNRLVSRGSVRLFDARMAGLRLDGSSTNSGDVDDNPGFGIPDSGQRFCLSGIAKNQSRHEKNQLLDATILLRRCLPRHDASGDYRRHDAFSSRRLSCNAVTIARQRPAFVHRYRDHCLKRWPNFFSAILCSSTDGALTAENLSRQCQGRQASITARLLVLSPAALRSGSIRGSSGVDQAL